MPLHAFAKKLLLDFTTGAATATQPTARWISLATGSPTDGGASDGPFTFAGTAGGRQTFNCGAAVSPNGYASNRSVMTFTATAACTPIAWNLWDAAGGGNRLAYGTLNAGVGIASGGLVTFARSNLVIVLDLSMAAATGGTLIDSGLKMTVTFGRVTLPVLSADFNGDSTGLFNPIRVVPAIAQFAGASTFFGDGSITSGSTAWQAVANFTGASSLTADLYQPVTLRLRSQWQKGEPNVADPHLRSYGDEIANQPNYIYTSFAGASSFTANAKSILQAIANFAGASTLKADPSVTSGVTWLLATGAWNDSGGWDDASFWNDGGVTWQASTAFAGASTFTANGQRYLPAIASFVGASTFKADSLPLVRAAVANFVGASTFTALNVTLVLQGIARFAGASTLKADSLALTRQAVANFAGASAFSITAATLLQQAIARFAGASTFFADGVISGAVTAWPANANWAGASTLKADSLALVRSVTAAFAGASTFAATGVLTQQAIARFAGASTLFADGFISGAVFTWQAVANWAGVSTFKADSLPLVRLTTAIFAGTSTAAIDALPLVRAATAAFAGTSGWSANALRYLPAIASFAGASTLTASTWQRMLVTASFVGDSTFIAAPWQRMLVSAQFPGAGGWLAVPTIKGAAITIEARFAGASAFNANAQRYLPAIAKFAGASTLIANGGRLYLAIAQFAGASSFAAVARRITFAVAQLSGSSAFAGNVLRFLPAVANFTGDSTLLAKLVLAGTGEAEADWVGTSAMRIVATVVRNPNVKVLHGSVVTGRTLRGEVVQDGTLRGDMKQRTMLRAG